MASYVKTITNSIEFLGMGPPTLYSAATYGTSVYGEGSNDFIQGIGKYLSNSLSLAETVIKSPRKLINEEIFPSMDMLEEKKGDGSGYYYVFRKPSQDAEDRSLATWVESTASAISFTCVAGASTNWTES